MSILSEEISGGTYLVKLRGPLTAAQAEDVTGAFSGLAEQGVRQVIIDLAEVPFIDSRGLAALISGYKIFGSSGQNFRLALPQDQPKLLFELTGFNRFFQVFEQLPAIRTRESRASTAVKLPSAAVEIREVVA